jgi:hypothetical protein
LKPYHVVTLLALVLAIVTAAGVGMVYFTRQSDQHTAALVISDGAILSEIHTLLTDGKSASAVNAKQAKIDAAAGDRIIRKVEDQLSEILSNSHVNHGLICYLVEQNNAPKALIQLDCMEATP